MRHGHARPMHQIISNVEAKNKSKIDVEEVNPLEAGKPTKNEKAIDWLKNLPVPKGGGLLQRLAEKDKALSEFYDLQDPFRRGFMLAEEIVKKWCEENYPLGK